MADVLVVGAGPVGLTMAWEGDRRHAPHAGGLGGHGHRPRDD